MVPLHSKQQLKFKYVIQSIRRERKKTNQKKNEHHETVAWSEAKKYNTQKHTHQSENTANNMMKA